MACDSKHGNVSISTAMHFFGKKDVHNTSASPKRLAQDASQTSCARCTQKRLVLMQDASQASCTRCTQERLVLIQDASQLSCTRYTQKRLVQDAPPTSCARCTLSADSELEMLAIPCKTFSHPLLEMLSSCLLHERLVNLRVGHLYGSRKSRQVLKRTMHLLQECWPDCIIYRIQIWRCCWPGEQFTSWP